MPGSPQKKQYSFTELLTLKRATETMRDVHVIAVVKFFRQPIKTRGTSYSMTLGLTDPSLEGDKFICTVLNDSIERLPQVKMVGDIVIFHRLCVDYFGETMRGSGLPGRGFASAVVSGAPAADLVVESDWPNFNVTPADLRRVSQLKEWYNSPECPVEKEPVIAETLATAAPPSPARSDSTSGVENDVMTLAQLMSPHVYFNFIGHVLAKFRFVDEPDCVMLRLWDGTQPHLEFFNVESLNQEGITGQEFLRMPRVEWLSRHRFVDVSVYDDHTVAAANIHPGNIVFLTNVHVVLSRARGVRFNQSACELRLHGGGRERFGRSLRRVDDRSQEPAANALRERLVRAHSKLQVASVPDGGQHMTLNEVLANSSRESTWKYFLKARVQAVSPAGDNCLQLLRWFCPQCHLLKGLTDLNTDQDTADVVACPECDGQAKLILLLQIVLEDSDGWVLAHIWREHALHFFGQYLTKASELLTDLSAFRGVSACLHCLPGNDLDCVLVSYLPESAPHVASMQFQIVDTQLRR